MFNQSQPVDIWLVGITVATIVAIIYVGILLVKRKQPKESE